MTPRYDWTPASEPPDTDRTVLIWFHATFGLGRFAFGRWESFEGAWYSEEITQWRDVNPPEEA